MKKIISLEFLGCLLTLFMLAGCQSTITAAPTFTASAQPGIVTPAASLAEIPIVIGERTFNELNNHGFSKDPEVTWSTDDLKVSSLGRMTGVIQVQTDGGVREGVQYKDILFLQLQGNYIWPQIGDLQYIPLSDVLPLLPVTADEHSAEFVIDSNFQVPPLVNEKYDGLPLKSMSIKLTWVRLFKNKQEIFAQVFAGSGDRYSPLPQIHFDEVPRSLTGRFDYAWQLPETELQGGRTSNLTGEFDYLAWIRANIIWQK
jgi:hypothetical protein